MWCPSPITRYRLQPEQIRMEIAVVSTTCHMNNHPNNYQNNDVNDYEDEEDDDDDDNNEDNDEAWHE